MRNGGLKGAVAVALEDGNGIAQIVGRGQINFAVPIEVAGRHPERVVARRQRGRRTERAVAISQKHTQAIAPSIGGSHVEFAIGIEIGYGGVRGRGAGRRRRAGPESAVPIAQENADRVIGVHHSQRITRWC